MPENNISKNFPPDPWNRILPDPYWVRLSKEQLWRWMDVICAARNIEDKTATVGSVIHLYGYAKILFENKEVVGENGYRQTDYTITDWKQSELFCSVEREFRDNGLLKVEHYLPLIKWCILRIDLHEQAQALIKKARKIKKTRKNQRQEARL